jgi:quercetin dioxygenase-like cupin family protein
MQSIKDIPSKEPMPGITGYYAHGDKHTFGYVEIKKGTVIAEHHHLHEQITYVIEGQLNMTLAGQSCPLTAGMYHIIPSNTPHSAVAVTDCKLIDTFSPTRDDYK